MRFKTKNTRTYIFIIFVVFNLFLLFYYDNNDEKSIVRTLFFNPFFLSTRTGNAFIDKIQEYSKTVVQPDGPPLKFIILAMTDHAFKDMAINLYISSFQRFDITNYLFVGTGEEACRDLNLFKIHCFHYTDDPDSNVSNSFNSKSFIRKMNIRTDMILDALRAGYTVLHMDLDVVFLQNPLPYLEKSISTSNMAILWDSNNYNAGFLIIKPTEFSIEVYEESQLRTNQSDILDDQTALNQALKEITNRRKDLDRNITSLDPELFLCGRNYFQFKDRDFPWKNGSDSCPGCLVVHNNWIVSMEAKIYRFKETNMWWVDKDGYYSDVNRKYLLYDNPILNASSFNVTFEEENALKSALAMAQILNRTLILPRFHCTPTQPTKECPLISLFKVKFFDATFGGSYRESSFLHSHLVPANIRFSKPGVCLNKDPNIDKNTSKICSIKKNAIKNKCFNNVPTQFVIQTEKSLLFNLSYSPDEIILLNIAKKNSLDDESVLKIFGHCEDPVLYIVSMLGVQVTFIDANHSKVFKQKILKGIVHSGYMQF